MRVICIDDSFRKKKGNCHRVWRIRERGIYTAINEIITNENLVVYILEEDPENFKYGWEVDRFIPLSNIDEMELLKERYGVEAENNFA